MRGYFYILDARWYNRSMNNDIVQLTDKSGNNIYPIAGGATQDSISKSMLAEGVFEGPELFPSPNEAYVRTANIVDGAVTSDKIDWTTIDDVVTNANGTAFKFHNGMMVAYIAKEVTTDAQYGIYQWNFPVAFTAVPVVVAPICRTSSYVVIAPSVDGGNNTVANIKSNKLSDGAVLTNATLSTFSAFAIGKWK